jgi:hypothetical protein
MAAYLRSLFGSSGQSAIPAHGKAKTRSRTESTPAPSPYYVYTPPTTSASSSGKSLRKDQRNTPVVSSSPLRYPTHDSRRSHEHSRPPLYRAASHKPHHDNMNGLSHLPLTHISSSEAHIPARGIPTGRIVAQFPQSGYVTPGSSRSNSSSSLYPGPVHGTPFVPSPLVPSPPRSKTSDDLPSKTPVAQNKAWQAGVSTSASGSSTCTCFLFHHLPLEPELNFTLFSHTIHRWPGTITLAIPSPRTPLSHAPPSLLHPATSRSHLLRHSIHTLRTHSRRSHTALSLPSRNISPARD